MRSRMSVVMLALFASACGGAQNRETSPGEGNIVSIEQGEHLIEQGDYLGASKVFGEILQKTPEDSEAHYYLAVAKKNLGDATAALEHYRLALKYDADLLAARNNLGLLLLENGDLVAAEKELNTYLEHKPEMGAAHYNYGLVLEALGKRIEAKKHYKKATELEPEAAASWFALGDLSKQEGDMKAALQVYKQGRTAIPDSPELTLKEAQTLLDLKKVKQAVEVFEELKKIPNCPPEFLTTAGVLLLKHKKDALAMDLYRLAIERDENYPLAHFLIANALARKKEFKEASEHYEKFIALAPDTEEAQIARERLKICVQQK